MIKGIFKSVLAVVLSVGLFTACNNKSNDVVRIGFINPMTGELATYGEAVKRGVDVALEEVNKDSLLGGKIKRR